VSERKDLERSWSVTRNFLALAKDALLASHAPESENLRFALHEYEEYLSYNELELALDALEGAADDHEAGNDFWRMLSLAASNMELHDRADELAKRMR